MEFPMKKIKYFGIVFLICSVMASCARKEKDDKNTNLLLVNLLYSASGAKAVLYMEQIDPFTFSGYCMDNFSPVIGAMKADTYYNQHPTSGLLGVLQRSKLVGKNKTTNKYQSCSDLGFSGATPQNEGDGITYDLYSCGPQTSAACDSKASKEVGY